MDKLPCSFCGLPVRVIGSPAKSDGPVYCCSGCALAAQIPLGDGDLPISRQLVAALAIGFGFFNQFLFWSLALALRGEQRLELASRFDLIALFVGGLVLCAGMALFVSASVRRWSDWLGLGVSIILVVTGIFFGLKDGMSASVPWVFVANASLLGFLGRGWLKRIFRRRPG